MLDVDLPYTFTAFAGSFKWAGLQFPELIPRDLFEVFPADKTRETLGGATRYLITVKASAEQLFVSSIIIQAALALVILTFHALLNYCLQRKFKKVPESLAYPKFEIAQLLTMCAAPCTLARHQALQY